MAGVIRRATEANLDAVMAAYDAARAFMRATGNLTQWVGGYPSRAGAERDLAGGWLWVLDDGRGARGLHERHARARPHLRRHRGASPG